jgi:uncharacterized protein (DUF302 family)
MSGAILTETTEHVSRLGFEATVERLAKAIVEAGLTLFARIDHAAGAREVGMTMPPAVVLIYGHARGGTPVMLAAPLAALDLPLRVLVRERSDGKTAIALHPVDAMLRALGVDEALAGRLLPAQKLLVDAISE